MIGQAVGFVALLFAIISFQQNNKKRILLLQMCSGFLFTVHFAMIGAYLGSVLNFIGMVRSIVFYNRDKKWGSSKIWLLVFSVAFIIAGAATWKNIVSILPILSMVLSTVSFWVKSPRHVRFITLPASPLWMIYNYINSSYAGVMTEVFVSVSIISAIIRFDIIPKFKKKKDL